MSGKWPQLAGHFVELLGVFFLSVEAIKLPNFLRLRDSFLLPLSHALRFEAKKFSGTMVGNMLHWSESDLEDFGLEFRRFVVFHLVTGWIVLGLGLLIWLRLLTPAQQAALGHLLSEYQATRGLVLATVAMVFMTFCIVYSLIYYFSSRLPPPITLFAYSLITLVNPLLLVGMILGEVGHLALDRVTKGALSVLRFIDARTPDGTIGIIGFVLVCLALLCQVQSRRGGGSWA
jgi:hypothetical protein